MTKRKRGNQECQEPCTGGRNADNINKTGHGSNIEGRGLEIVPGTSDEMPGVRDGTKWFICRNKVINVARIPHDPHDGRGNGK